MKLSELTQRAGKGRQPKGAACRGEGPYRCVHDYRIGAIEEPMGTEIPALLTINGHRYWCLRTVTLFVLLASLYVHALDASGPRELDVFVDRENAGVRFLNYEGKPLQRSVTALESWLHLFAPTVPRKKSTFVLYQSRSRWMSIKRKGTV